MTSFIKDHRTTQGVCALCTFCRSPRLLPDRCSRAFTVSAATTPAWRCVLILQKHYIGSRLMRQCAPRSKRFGTTTGVCSVWTAWRQLRLEGEDVAVLSANARIRLPGNGGTVTRLMTRLSLQGAVRKGCGKTIPDSSGTMSPRHRRFFWIKKHLWQTASFGRQRRTYSALSAMQRAWLAG